MVVLRKKWWGFWRPKVLCQRPKVLCQRQAYGPGMQRFGAKNSGSRDGHYTSKESGLPQGSVEAACPNRGDSLDRNIDAENRSTKDFLILDGHEEADEESPKKAKFFFSTAVQNWDAEFYVKVDNNIALDLEGLIELLESRRGQDGVYIGCMKSGEVVAEAKELQRAIDVRLATVKQDLATACARAEAAGFGATRLNDAACRCCTCR